MSLGLLGALGGLGKGLTQYGQTLFSEAIEEKREARLQAIRDKEYARSRADAVADRDMRITATQEAAQTQIDAANARLQTQLDAQATQSAADRQSRESIAAGTNATRVLIANATSEADLMKNVKPETDARGNQTLYFVDPVNKTKTPLAVFSAQGTNVNPNPEMDLTIDTMNAMQQEAFNTAVDFEENKGLSENYIFEMLLKDPKFRSLGY